MHAVILKETNLEQSEVIAFHVGDYLKAWKWNTMHMMADTLINKEIL